MGNDMGTLAGGDDVSHRSNPGNRMAISAMANVTQLERPTILALRNKIIEIASEEHAKNQQPAARTPSATINGSGSASGGSKGALSISRDGFRTAMGAVGVHHADKEILDRLFTMFDQTGDDVVDHREFLCGVSPLIPGTVQEKLEFAFMVFDVSGAGIMRPHEMLFVLKSEFPCRCTSRL
mmetsp:Transcript_4679/g.9156  ORF Transcript_4679/g.9156 Transcript_4679/m.9156 type:complete len:181 (-) Transcript_4679:957-1499(-)